MFNSFFVECVDNIFNAIFLFCRSNRFQSLLSEGKLISFQLYLSINGLTLLILCAFLPISFECIEIIIEYAKQQLSCIFCGLITAFLSCIQGVVGTYDPPLFNFNLINCTYVRSTQSNTKLLPLYKLDSFSKIFNMLLNNNFINSCVSFAFVSIKASLVIYFICLSNSLLDFTKTHTDFN